jgi:hypothetical protein
VGSGAGSAVSVSLLLKSLGLHGIEFDHGVSDEPRKTPECRYPEQGEPQYDSICLMGPVMSELPIHFQMRWE